MINIKKMENLTELHQLHQASTYHLSHKAHEAFKVYRKISIWPMTRFDLRRNNETKKMKSPDYIISLKK